MPANIAHQNEVSTDSQARSADWVCGRDKGVHRGLMFHAPAAVKAAVGLIRPDAVINELTSLPRHYTPAEMNAAAERDRKVRVE